MNPLGVVFTVFNPSRPCCSHALLYPYPIENNALATACERLFSTCIVCTRLAASHLCLAPVSSACLGRLSSCNMHCQFFSPGTLCIKPTLTYSSFVRNVPKSLQINSKCMECIINNNSVYAPSLFPELKII